MPTTSSYEINLCLAPEQGHECISFSAIPFHSLLEYVEGHKYERLMVHVKLYVSRFDIRGD